MSGVLILAGLCGLAVCVCPGQHRFTSGVKRLGEFCSPFPHPGKTEDSLAIARDADEMVFFTPS